MKKQKKMRNYLKRIISVILMIALIAGVSWSDAFIKKVKANEIRNEEDVQENNNQITNCDVFNLENGAIKTVISYKDGSRLETVYYADGNVVERMFNSLNEIVGTDTSNTVEIFEDLGIDSDVLESEIDVDDTFDSSIIDENLTKGKKIKWSKPVRENYSKKNNIWYKCSLNTKTEWLRIGCKAKYVINCDKLNDRQYEKVVAFKNAINGVRADMKKAKIIGNVSSVVLGAVLGVVAGLLAAGVAIATITAKIVGLGLVSGCSTGVIQSMVIKCVDACKNFELAKENYNIIKNYGKKYK